MKQFEYKTVTATINDMNSYLEALGLEGWELCLEIGFAPIKAGMHKWYFKREMLQ